MRENLEKLLSRIEEKLLNPFKPEGLEEDFKALLETLRSLGPEEIKEASDRIDRVVKLFVHNLNLVEGYIRPIYERGDLISRRA